MASLTFRGLKKSFQAQTILHGISLRIDDGEFIALVGPSGCGKSTLLRMVAGLEQANDGDILLGEHRINDASPRDRDVAMVFQNYALYPHMSVADNLGFALKLQGTSSDEIARRVQDVAATLGLDALLSRLPAQLSGGQRQRVAMGRAIIRKPKAFLFDEPLSNLDAKLRVQMRTEIKALHQRLRTTTLYVTHDQIEAMTMADRIVVMREGRIEQVGTPLELYTNPANAFVAQFIGSPSMNLIGGRLDTATGQRALVTDDGIRIPVPATAGVEPGKRLLLGVRPEHLTIAPQAHDGIRLDAHVLVVEPTGAETQIVAELGTRRLTCVARGHFQQPPGTRLPLAIPAQHAYLFDEASGARLT